MELRVLNYFLMVAREENITRAANILHITQPTLSRQLMQLEEELGVKLFHRSKHQIILTEEGRLLKRRAQELVSLADKTKREFLQEEGQVVGEIAIGSGELHSVKAFSKLLAAFREKYPLVRYEFYSGNVDNIKERMENGLLDFGILGEPADIKRYGFIRLPVNDTWGVLVSHDSGLAERAFVRPEDLIQIPLFISNRELVKNELANWFGKYYERLDIIASYNLLYNVAMMVQQNIGAALCIKLDCTYEGLSFVPLSPRLELRSVLAWKTNQVFSKAALLFIEHAKQYVKSTADDMA